MSILRRFRGSEGGYYIVNQETYIPVAGPYSTLAEADDERIAINARYEGIDDRPDVLQVVRLVGGAA